MASGVLGASREFGAQEVRWAAKAVERNTGPTGRTLVGVVGRLEHRDYKFGPPCAEPPTTQLLPTRCVTTCALIETRSSA